MADEFIVNRYGTKALRFLMQEFQEWVAKKDANPGIAWKEWPERWEKMLNKQGEKDYTYNERLNYRRQLAKIIVLLKDHPFTRQAYIDLRHPKDISRLESGCQIPCINGYQFHQIEKNLSITVMARSIDANNCLMNDIWLADRLLDYVVDTINYMNNFRMNKKVSPGSVSFMISNLHKYPDMYKRGYDRI